MTPEELDEARAREALRCVYTDDQLCPSWSGFTSSHQAVIIAAARLAREGWEPRVPLDPDLIEARRIAAGLADGNPGYRDRTLIGGNDTNFEVRSALTAIKRGRELERGGK